MKTLAPLLLAIVLAACAAPEAVRQADPTPPAADPSSRTEKEITHAATTPLGDLNLAHGAIPPVLAAARKNPYLLPADTTCAGLASEVEALDAALGADLDTPATASNPGLIERGAGAAGNAAVGALRGAAEGVIPYRYWVRKISGAERYEKETAAAIAAGAVRRAFLKGLGQASACQVPAAPRH